MLFPNSLNIIIFQWITPKNNAWIIKPHNNNEKAGKKTIEIEITLIDKNNSYIKGLWLLGSNRGDWDGWLIARKERMTKKKG